MKLLLVEDEEDLSNIVSKVLRKRGYAVDTALDGEEALYQYQVNEYDLIILDLNLPKIDGLAVLEKIRETDALTKVIILSARSDISQRVEGLDRGANDYLVKPFDLQELEARIRTLLRISFTQAPVILSCGILSLNMSLKEVYLGSDPLSLTKKEYSILEYLFLHKNTILSAEELVEHVWDSDADLFSNSLKYHIHSIKKKLSSRDPDIDYIRNIRSQGYILKEDAK